jgi:hypothetical protein
MGRPKTRSSQTSATLPGRIRGPLLSPAIRLLSGPGDRRERGLGAFVLDPAEYARIGQTIGETAFGGNLDVANTPQGQELIRTITEQSQRSLGEDLAGLRSRFALSGQNLSGPLMQTSAQTVERAGQNRDAIMAQQLFSMLDSERARQLGALGALSGFQRTPEDIALRVGELFSGTGKQRGTGTKSGGLSFLGK